MLTASAAVSATVSAADRHAIGVAQIQQLYVTLGPKSGGRGRTAMADLKRDYETHFKYSGKV